MEERLDDWSLVAPRRRKELWIAMNMFATASRQVFENWAVLPRWKAGLRNRLREFDFPGDSLLGRAVDLVGQGCAGLAVKL